MARPPGICVFCGGGGLTKEHVIAEWVQSVLPKESATSWQHITRTGYGGWNNPAPLPSSFRPQRQGDVLTRKLYCVCKNCNNGGMSRLQERAKPVITHLLLGTWDELTPDQQALVSAWIAMTTMVYEFVDPPTVAIPQAERSAFMQEQQPPEHWWIAIGVLRNPSRLLAHTGAYIYLGETPPPAIGPMNTQTTVVAVGRLIFQAFSSAATSVNLEITGPTLRRLGLTSIWPRNADAVRPVRPLDNQEAERIFIALRSALNSAFNRSG